MHKLGIPNLKHKHRYTVYGVVGGYNPKKDIAVTGATFEELKKKMNTPTVLAWLREYEQKLPDYFKCH
tara:strand:- start:487 stop:690 length:204 start_codon:yes stop_codon:yes gene_type:complete